MADSVSQEDEREVDLPLPPPDTLAAYQAIDHRFVDHLLETFHAENLHRRELQRNHEVTAARFMLRGQALSFALGFSAIVAAALLGIYGSGISAAILGAFPVASIIIAVVGRMMTYQLRSKKPIHESSDKDSER